MKKQKRAFHYLQDTYNFETNDMIDNMEVYLAYARYFMFIHAYDQAEVYYVNRIKKRQ